MLDNVQASGEHENCAEQIGRAANAFQPRTPEIITLSWTVAVGVGAVRAHLPAPPEVSGAVARRALDALRPPPAAAVLSAAVRGQGP